MCFLDFEDVEREEMSTDRSKLKIAYKPTESLKENPRNSRTHSNRQIRQIADSIKAFGFTNPILLDETDTVIAGAGRLSAARSLGIKEIPTIRLSEMSPAQIRAYAIADNRLAEKAGWDKATLQIELQELMTFETEFDITLTGFDIPEIDILLSSDAEPPDEPPDVDPDSQLVTELGDMWSLGRHRILCGNAVEGASYSRLLNGRRAGVIFVDPPFNLAIKGNVSGNGVVRHREFVMASGEMSEFQYVSFLESCVKLLVQYSVPGSVHFVCIDWRHVRELLTVGKQVYDSVLNVCVWVKNVGGMGSFYRSRHELVVVFRNGKEKHRNNVQLGQYGRNRTNVWEYSSINSTTKSGDEGNLLALHPTVKPVALIADALLDCSARGDLVLDAFLGSGSTLIAAERTGRACYGIELDPLYVDVAIRRWQRHTGDHAIHVVSGKRFDEVAADRVEARRG
jgi:DNA modification methylase